MIGLNVVATGSSGNCYFIRDGTCYLCLDCGESVKIQDIRKGCDWNVNAIDGVLITHRHSDHLPKVKNFLHSGIMCYSNDETQEFVEITQGEVITGLAEKKLAQIADWKVLPYYVPHEDIPCFAYLIRTPSGEKVFYMTDFQYSPVTLKNIGINHFLIACNRTDDIPDDAEARFHRIRGHSSLNVVKEFLEASMTDECKSVTVCHLSGLYANAGLILDELRFLCGEKIKVNIARKGLKLEL